MVDITILELQFPDAQFNAPFAASTDPESEAPASIEAEEAGEEGGSLVQAAVVLGVLFAFGLVAKRLRDARRGTGDEEAADSRRRRYLSPLRQRDS